jgi:hypothetical protein
LASALTDFDAFAGLAGALAFALSTLAGFAALVAFFVAVFLDFIVRPFRLEIPAGGKSASDSHT